MEGNIALVTGGDSGLGQCFSDAMLSAGAKVYHGFSVNMVAKATVDRSTRECSAKCRVMKYESNSCQSATFLRDTAECFLSNGTVEDMIYHGNSSYRTMVVLPSEPYLSYMGKEFYTGFMQNYDNATTLQLLFVGTAPTTVTVNIPALSLNESFDLYGSHVANYSYSLAHMVDGEKAMKGVHVSTTQPITLYHHNIRVYSEDISMILPITGIGKNYIIQTSPNDLFANNMFLVVSTKDANVVSKTKDSITTTVTLNRLETYYRYASNLMGTVETSAYDIAVLAGSPIATLPGNTDYGDHVYESLPPEESYGSAFVVGFMRPRPDYTVGLVAKVNQTVVTITDVNGLTLETLILNRAEPVYREFYDNQTITISSTGGILVTQYGHGDGVSEILPYGDPSMMVIAPLNKLGNKYDILLPTGAISVVEIVVDDETQIRFNGNPVTFDHSFTVSVPTVGPLRVAYVIPAVGQYRITHQNSVPFAVYVFGGRNKYTEFAMCAGWLK